MKPPYSESDLVLPALSILADAYPNSVATGTLSARLRKVLKPEGDDLTILAGRSDDKFSQKVRNLHSHRTLVRSGLATYANGGFVITPVGVRFLRDGLPVVESFRK